jgi:thymidylate synthase
MNKLDLDYQALLQDILENGVTKKDRTGTGTISVFGRQIRHRMSDGFPLLTTKKMAWRQIIVELLWFLRGDTNIKFLVNNNCHIWDGDAYKNYCKEYWNLSFLQDKIEYGSSFYNHDTDDYTFEELTQEDFINNIKTDDDFAKEWGELGPVYGKQWRNWKFTDKFTNGEQIAYVNGKIDQIENLINDLRTNPDDRGLIVSAWNVADLKSMVLRPCHNFFQCYTYEMSEEERLKEWCHSLGKDISYGEDMTERKLDALRFPKRKLSLKWNQRSVDVGLGWSFNCASYGLLLHLLAKEVNMIPDELIFTGGDCHIYLNHVEGLKKQLTQESYPLPTLKLHNSSLDELKYEDVELVGYKSAPSIKLELSN